MFDGNFNTVDYVHYHSACPYGDKGTQTCYDLRQSLQGSGATHNKHICYLHGEECCGSCQPLRGDDPGKLTHWPLGDLNEILDKKSILKLIIVIDGWGVVKMPSDEWHRTLLMTS